jgi:hypothetical protein
MLSARFISLLLSRPEAFHRYRNSFLPHEKDCAVKPAWRKVSGWPVNFIYGTLLHGRMGGLRRYEITIAFLAIAMLLSGCLSLLYPPQPKAVSIFGVAEPSGGYYELTEDDAFAIQGVLSTNISVFGTHLGSTMEEVIEAVGQADNQNVPADGQMNWEYSASLDMEKIGLLFHFDDEKVTRITVKKPFNKYLQGSTQINHTKEDLYKMFGKPDKMQLLTFFTVYSYYDQGIEVFMDGPKMNGFSLAYPQPEKAREKTP